MHRTNLLTLSAFFSIVCHLIFIQIFETHKKEQEIIVMDLSLFKNLRLKKLTSPPLPQKKGKNN